MDRHQVLTTFSDKLAMRDYVSSRLGDESLPLLIDSGSSVAILNGLVGPLVLKANHGSGMTILHTTTTPFSDEDRQKASRWLTVDYSWSEMEWGYHDARRLLLVEEFLHASNGVSAPTDYKFFTFDGRVEMVQIDQDRFSGHRRAIRGADWSPILGTLGSYANPLNPDLEAPRNLDQMLQWASILGEGIDFVRIDFYELNDRVLVGELTPYPGGGNERFTPHHLDAQLGRAWTKHSEDCF
jgi:hypothetical protein